MQYDRNENVGSTGPGGASGGSTGSSFGASESGFGTPGTTGTSGAGLGSGADTAGAATGSTGFADEREGTLHGARDTAREKLGAAREKAGELKATLADKLEAGANRLRQRSTKTDIAGATGATSGIAGDGQTQHGTLDKATDSLASGMQSTADWVRNADVQSVRNDVEQQVRANPGRALLVAVGVGYLLGKLIRGGGGNKM